MNFPNHIIDTLSKANNIRNFFEKDSSSKKQSPIISFNSPTIIPENEWPSHRIPYIFYQKAFENAEKYNINLTMEIIKFQSSYTIFFLDVILYCLIAYYQGFGENLISLTEPFESHEKHLNEIFQNLNQQLIQKGSASIHGNKIQIKKTYSNDRKTATVDYHGLDIKDVYPMTIAQYTRSIKDNNLQNLNIIAGKGPHSLHGASISMGLVLYFSCKNHLDSIFLPNNPGIQSFRLHRSDKNKS